MGGNLEDFSWYLERSKEKMVPHTGCGFGVSRILRWISGADDIKKAITFASSQHRII
jgi:asparaginyl-tRNA synthetase